MNRGLKWHSLYTLSFVICVLISVFSSSFVLPFGKISPLRDNSNIVSRLIAPDCRALHLLPPDLSPNILFDISMRNISSALGALLILSLGCSSQRHSETPLSAKDHAIIKTLSTRDRNAVHVVLWTLQQNGISNSLAISFDAPYSEVQPKIQAIREHLKTLSEDNLSALDQSLAYHWQIYSPVWSSQDWP